MKAVILAGGRGTRLGTLTEALPKPMVPICGKPLLEHQLGVLKRYGIDEVILSTGYRAEIVEEYFHDGKNFGVNISYAREDAPLGTAGALKSLEQELQDDFLVVYGDVLFDLNLTRLLALHKKHGSAGTLVLHPNDHPNDSDLVELDWKSRQVTAFHAKPHAPGRHYRNMVNAGAYVLSPLVLEHLALAPPSDLGRHVFPRLVDRLPLFGYVTGEYIKDMGTPERLRQVTDDWQSGKVARLNNANPRRAAFLDRDGVLNRHVGLVSRPEQLELLPGVADGVRAINQSDLLAIVVTNQPVVARGMCSIQDLEAIHGRFETLLGDSHAKVDAIYYCPHHPDRGYPEENPEYKIACDCRKPGIGMILQAAQDYNITLADSYFIGDTERDVACGRRAGLTTITVPTGEPWPAGAAAPDFAADSFAQAVEIVLRGDVPTSALQHTS
jgi:mannose-1-phosphate guanylyltransferase / phosphomannomutase